MLGLKPRRSAGTKRNVDSRRETLRDLISHPCIGSILDFSIGVLVTCFFVLLAI